MKYNFLNYNLPKLHAVDCKIRGFLFRRKLRKVAKFIELHNLYPMNYRTILINSSITVRNLGKLRNYLRSFYKLLLIKLLNARSDPSISIT